MPIIPAPVQYEPLDGVEFTWPERAEVVADSTELQREGLYLVGGTTRRSRQPPYTVAIPFFI
jgi:hypothetical protein